jgi:hypothetical protein
MKDPNEVPSLPANRFYTLTRVARSDAGRFSGRGLLLVILTVRRSAIAMALRSARTCVANLCLKIFGEKFSHQPASKPRW